MIFPSSLQEIKHLAFRGCKNLKTVIFSDGIEVIDYAAFIECDSIETLQLPNSLKVIEDFAFNGCKMLTEIVIPNSVDSIGYYVFEDCSSVETLILGSSLSSIGSCAFYGCSSIKQIISYNPTPPQASGNPFGTVDKTIPVYIPKGSLELYKEANEFYKFSNFIEVDFTGIEECCSDGKQNLFISGETLVVSGVSEPITVTVYNLKGVVVLTQTITTDNTFDISNLPKGVYVVKANNQTVKVVL